MIHQTTAYPSSAEWSSLSRQRQESWEQAIESAMLSEWFKSMTPSFSPDKGTEPAQKDSSIRAMQDHTSVSNLASLNHSQHFTGATILNRPTVYMASAINVQLHHSEILVPDNQDVPPVDVESKIQSRCIHASISSPLNDDTTQGGSSSAVQWLLQPSNTTPSSVEKSKSPVIGEATSLIETPRSGIKEESIYCPHMFTNALSPEKTPQPSAQVSAEPIPVFLHEPIHHPHQQQAFNYIFKVDKSDKSVLVSKSTLEHSKFDTPLLQNSFADHSDARISFHEENGFLRIWLGLSYSRFSEINGIIEVLQQWVKEKKYTLLSITCNGQKLEADHLFYQGFIYGNYSHR